MPLMFRNKNHDCNILQQLIEYLCSEHLFNTKITKLFIVAVNRNVFTYTLRFNKVKIWMISTRI